jgi:hypothetical protein
MKIDYLVADISIAALADSKVFYGSQYNIVYQRNPEGYFVASSVFIPINKISYVVFQESDD